MKLHLLCNVALSPQQAWTILQRDAPAAAEEPTLSSMVEAADTAKSGRRRMKDMFLRSTPRRHTSGHASNTSACGSDLGTAASLDWQAPSGADATVGDAASGLIRSIPEHAPADAAALHEDAGSAPILVGQALTQPENSGAEAEADTNNVTATSLDAEEVLAASEQTTGVPMAVLPLDDALPDQDISKITADDITAQEVVVEVIVATTRLAQTHEWTSGRYLPISWPNILSPDWSQDLDMQDATMGVSATVRLPDVCINQ